MKRKNVNIADLVGKGYKKDMTMGISDVYIKQEDGFKRILLYQPERKEILINVTVPNYSFRKYEKP